VVPDLGGIARAIGSFGDNCHVTTRRHNYNGKLRWYAKLSVKTLGDKVFSSTRQGGGRWAIGAAFLQQVYGSALWNAPKTWQAGEFFV
jgi:hypothetical protein